MHRCHEDEDKAFQESKRLLTSSRVLVHYSTKLPLLLACDASPFGLGAVLSHRLEMGMNIPLPFHRDRFHQRKKIIHRLTVKGLQSNSTVISMVDTLNFCLITNH